MDDTLQPELPEEDVAPPPLEDVLSEAELGDEMSPEQRAEAKEYGRRELICDLVGRFVDVAFLAFAALVLGRPGGWLMSILPTGYPQTIRLALLFLVLIFLNMLISFPLSFYSGHVLEHQFGLSRQSFGQWFSRFLKRNLLELALGVVLVPGLYWLIWTTGSWWWLVAAVVFFMLSVVLGQLAPVLILPLFYKIERLDAGESEELNQRMARLAEGTGLSIEGVFRMDLSAETVKANAMLTGLGRTRRVILGDTLLEKFTPDEIEVIFAHEIGHHVYRHIHKMIVTGAIYSTLGFLVCDRLLAMWVARFEGAVDYAQFPIYTLPMMMLIITVFSMVLEPLQNSISRHYERQCDKYALQSTGLREAYQSAFRKLAILNKDDPDPNPVEVFLFHSHPPIAERVALAEE